MSQANIDVRVMGGVFVVRRRGSADGLPNGISIKKDAQWIEKSLWAFVGRVMRVAQTRLCCF